MASKEVQRNKNDATLFDLGFSTFFLNRVNRSGIITAGVIGGNTQVGKYTMTARFNKPYLIDKIIKIHSLKKQIVLTNADAKEIIDTIQPYEKDSLY